MVQGDSDCVAIGPWGGSDGRPFDFWSQGTITEIVIEYRDHVIDTIAFKSKTADGTESSSPKFGAATSGMKTYKVSFSPGEYITGIEIMFKKEKRLDYLSISTNVRTYSPFGSIDETKISIPIADGTIVGFFGRSSSYIYALGVYVYKPKKPDHVQENKVLKSWTYLPQGLITKIVIGHADVIDSLVFESKTSDGVVISSERFGGTGGQGTEVLINSGEFITGIDVMVGKYNGQNVINYMSIDTNVKKYGPFGTGMGSKVSIPIKEGSVVGFSGLASKYLNSFDIFEIVEPKRTDQEDEVVRSWSYVPQGVITKIVITHEDIIDSLVFESKTSEGVVVSSQRFGGFGGTSTEVLISSGEFITGIDLMVGVYKGQEVINYMSIDTNVKSYGPFGTGTGSKISIPIKEGSGVGFFGLAGKYLNTFEIFEIVEPKTPDQEDKVVKSWSYVPQGLITKIVIMHGDIVDSMVFESKTSDGVVISSQRFGGPGGTLSEVLISSEEFITGIDVMVGEYNGQNVISYMSIETNVKKYGPFGTGTGSIISIPIKEGSAFGFFGLAGMYMNTFDIFEIMEPKRPEQEDKDVKSWTYVPQGLITKIVIMHEDIINSLVFESKTSDGIVVSSQRFGGPGGTSNEVLINSGEYITGIDVMVGEYNGQNVINYMSIDTNVNKYGPFGTATGSKVSIPIKEGRVVGFFGLAGIYVNSFDIFEIVEPKRLDQEDEVVKSWTYVPQGVITRIVIMHGDIINSLVFESKTSDGVVISSQRFGGPGGTSDEVLISSGEFITGINVMIGEYDGQKVINYMNIGTNVKTYGPFGTATGSNVSIPIKEGSIVGFFGHAGVYLNTFDIFEVVEPKSPNQEDKAVLLPSLPISLPGLALFIGNLGKYIGRHTKCDFPPFFGYMGICLVLIAIFCRIFGFY